MHKFLTVVDVLRQRSLIVQNDRVSWLELQDCDGRSAAPTNMQLVSTQLFWQVGRISSSSYIQGHETCCVVSKVVARKHAFEGRT